MIRLTIDGQEIAVPEGTLVVDAAARAGIEVPIYCYHEALGSLGACRICLVEIEKMPKLATACTTKVAEGMVVRTSGPAVDKGRKGILEFLLINHPLDCPVCDKGGECFLQDYAFFYGSGKNRFEEAKIQRQKDYPVSPYILLDQERCVLCQRCVRFMGEYVGEEQLMLDGRGVHTVVSTVAGRPADSPFAGNVIDLCPVGALLSEPYHYKARPWNIEREESFCTECPVGCPSFITGRDGRLVRMEGRPIDNNWGWLCDNGRFTYDLGDHPDRLLEPIAEGGVRNMADVTKLLGERIQAVVTEHGPNAVAILTGGIHPVEDDYALKRFAEDVVGTDRIGLLKPVRSDFPMELLGTFEDLEHADLVLLAGCDPYEAVPVVHLRLREAVAKQKTAVWGLGDRVLTRSTLTGRNVVIEPGTMADVLGRGLRGKEQGDVGDLSHALLEAPKVTVLWDGEDPRMTAVLRDLAARRGELATHVLPTYGPRSWLGAHRVGIDTSYRQARNILQDAAQGEVKLLLLWGADPVRDFPEGDLAAKAIERCPEVYFAGWFPPVGAETMTALLPTAAWGEGYGTYVNMEGRLQVAKGAANAPGQARPTKTVLQSVARAVGRPLRFSEDWDPFDDCSGDLIPRPSAQPENSGDSESESSSVEAGGDAGEGYTVITGTDVSVSHWPSETAERMRVTHPVRMNPEDLAALAIVGKGTVRVRAGEQAFTINVRPDQRIPAGRVYVPYGLQALPVNRLARLRVQVEKQEEVTAG